MTTRDAGSAWMQAHEGRASFLEDPRVDKHVERMSTTDVSGQGYVADLTAALGAQLTALPWLASVAHRPCTIA